MSNLKSEKLHLVDSPVEYNTYMKSEIFNICTNKSVIELGPFDGWHTQLIKENNPSKVTVVEGNSKCKDTLSSAFPDYEIIIQDAFEFYKENHYAEVVVCCGLLYHLHSPLYLLELIANKSDPEFIIVDSVPDDYYHAYYEEVDNIPGNRFTSTGWKSCGLNCTLPYSTMTKGLKNLGYKEVFFDQDIKRFNVISKHGWLAIFRKEQAIS